MTSAGGVMLTTHGIGGQLVQMDKKIVTAGNNLHWESCPNCQSRDLILSRTPEDAYNRPNQEAPTQYRMYCRKCNLTTDWYPTEEDAVSSWNEYAVQAKKERQEPTDQEKVLAENPYLQPDWADKLVSQDSQYRLIQLEILCDGFNRIVNQIKYLSSRMSSTDSMPVDKPQELDGYLHRAMEAQRRKAGQV